jgi:hypothetical protein
MNERKLNRLFGAVRREPPPAGPGDLDERVMGEIRGEARPPMLSIADHLNVLFPKLTCAAVLVIGLCIAGDVVLGAMNYPELAEGVAQISDQWLLTESGI